MKKTTPNIQLSSSQSKMSTFSQVSVSDANFLDGIDPNIDNPNKKSDEVKVLEEKVQELKINESLDSIFIVPTPDETAIALIDTSASTTLKFCLPVKDQQGRTVAPRADGFENSVFGAQCEILKKLPHKKFYLLFWSSAQNSGLYQNGFRTIPGAVSKESMELLFKTEFYKIEDRFLTNTALAFQRLPPDWLKTTKTVYLVTDGAMGGGNLDTPTVQRELSNSLKYFRGNLSILTVERTAKDFGNVEEVNNAAGSDVYKTVQENKLTNFICKFVSHYPGALNPETKCCDVQSFTHIQKMTPPTGYIPYGERYFLELNMDKFVKFIANEINDVVQNANVPGRNSESEQLTIAQRLTSTMFHLLKNKSSQLIDYNIKMFSRLFTLDQQVIYYILGESILQEREGKAQIIADYRRNLQNLFKDAQRKLNENVSQAISIGSAFCSFPVWDSEYRSRALMDEHETKGCFNILTGPSKIVIETFNAKNGKFPRSCVSSTPVFGVYDEKTKLSLFNDQCLRQWIRTVYASRFNVNVQDDLIIYLVLAEVLAVYRSSIDASIKSSYLTLARTILNKKRISVEITEAKHLLDGNAPNLHNGTIDDFIATLESVIQMLGFTGKPMRLWFEIVQMLEVVFPGMLDAQRVHCENHTDFNSELKTTIYRADSVAAASMYDFNCYLTLVDVSKEGGYGFVGHKSPTGFDCSPAFMLSQDGMQELKSRGNYSCPVCYARLNESYYVRVPPQIESKVPTLYSIRRSGVKSSDNNRYLIFMRGTVGAGKTTLSNFIQEKYTKLGFTVFNEGTDKYCKSGIQTRQAIGLVKRELSKAVLIPSRCIVIIDTCGEIKSSAPFDINFDGWTTLEIYPNLDRNNLMGYLAWSLTNVLSRGPSGRSTEFYLCPSAKPGQEGINLCKDVHRKKAIALNLYDRNFSNLSDSDRLALAAQYAKTMKPVEFELPM